MVRVRISAEAAILRCTFCVLIAVTAITESRDGVSGGSDQPQRVVMLFLLFTRSSARSTRMTVSEAIDCNDGDQAARIIQDASASTPTTSPTTASRRPGPRTASSAPASSANGYKLRRAIWPDRKRMSV